MASCKHSALELIPERKKTVRCKHCHLTMSADELGDGYCPECFDGSGEKLYDFETLANPSRAIAPASRTAPTSRSRSSLWITGANAMCSPLALPSFGREKGGG